MVHFEKVTWDNWKQCCSLKADKYVANNVTILAKAFVSKNEGEAGDALAIFNDEEVIGLIFYREFGYPEKYCYIIDQFMIDSRYQGNGYGKSALNLLIEKLKREGKYNKIELEYYEENEVAEKLYLNAGFYHFSSGYGEEGMVEVAYDLIDKIM